MINDPTTGQPVVVAPLPSASPVSTIIRALVVLVMVSVIGVILASVLVPGNTGLIIQILGVALPTTGALLAYLQSTANQAKIQAIHVDVNSRLTQLLSTQGESERAKGVIEGSEALSVRSSSDTMAASLQAAIVAKQAAETAAAAAQQVTLAAQQAAAVLAQAAAIKGEPG